MPFSLRQLPNLLTLARMVAGAAVCPLVIWGDQPMLLAALTLFTLAAATDRLDGWLARSLDAETTLGKVLDPLADKVLILCTVLGLILGDVLTGVHGLAVVAILLREFLVTGCRDLMAKFGHDLPVSTLAKWKTAAQMVAAGLLLGAAALELPWLYDVGLVTLWIATALTVWTGLVYGAAIVRVTQSIDAGANAPDAATSNAASPDLERRQG